MDILWDLASIVELTRYIYEKKYEAIPNHQEDTVKLLYEQGNSMKRIGKLTGIDSMDIVWILHKEELMEFEKEMFAQIERFATIKSNMEKE